MQKMSAALAPPDDSSGSEPELEPDRGAENVDADEGLLAWREAGLYDGTVIHIAEKSGFVNFVRVCEKTPTCVA
jgi:hypothetical protein